MSSTRPPDAAARTAQWAVHPALGSPAADHLAHNSASSHYAPPPNEASRERRIDSSKLLQTFVLEGLFVHALTHTGITSALSGLFSNKNRIRVNVEPGEEPL